MASVQEVFLYNTMARAAEQLRPIEPGKVKLYCCGPTVYHFQHIGNLRTYIFEDLLVRTLRNAGYEVRHVMNITDVGHLVSDADQGEDKMLVAARREGKKSFEIADHYTELFFADCAKLNIRRPDVVCKATDHVQQMIELIKRLESRGLVYQSGGNVYFDISKLPDYGKLARLDLSAMEAGARIEVDKSKRNPYDFALWFTKSKFEGQELVWDSPWGVGYPGWHIECSAMSMCYLGDEFDIHCGGIDHVPVHHTNEIAQSEGATGKPWVRIWMHGGFLVNEQAQKMAKSAGGFLTVKSLEERGFDPLAYRLLCLGTHYRTQLTFSWDAMTGAQQSLDRLRRAVHAYREESPETPKIDPSAKEMVGEFERCMRDDLAAPRAMAVVWGIVNSKELSAGQKLAALEQVDKHLALGIAGWKAAAAEDLPPQVLQLVAERDNARRAKEWKRSDELRDQLSALGYIVKDDPSGTKVTKR